MDKTPFKPKPGQVDFTDVRWAPVINCVLRHAGRLLVVQRSEGLDYYPGYWTGISGFLDDHRSLEEKVADEIGEELGMPRNMIESVRLGEIFDQEEPQYRKTWIVHPVLVEVGTDEVRLDWEARHYQWLSLVDIKKLNLLPGFDEVLEKLSPWIDG